MRSSSPFNIFKYNVKPHVYIFTFYTLLYIFLFSGPHTWSKSFPAAAGKRQSPIDILTYGCAFDEELASKPLTINYQTEKDLTLGNCGYSLKAGVKAESCKSYRIRHPGIEYELEVKLVFSFIDFILVVP